MIFQGSDLQKGLKELDDKIRYARVVVRDERINYDIKKSEVEQKLADLKVKSHPVVCNIQLIGTFLHSVFHLEL